ncbi:PucR family transcriptional regulator [Alicyclobacillus ferrooxydans]|uniref:PucR C-terminal helix-turn-helix domain-containing protein n=1 Tax=Alicyclobacillus ferrooxydans TaxID=471514 RepID=A0A0P9D0A8_9BACL|nr:helix-turn-helix domain-containing protein [Alicyclobacillus ferrooxydans]KPV45446.1 hypothetical protein AN477_00245 [Alicyclobacillus ferrooxydans]
MTTAGMWWADTLESFSEALEQTYDLVQERHPAVRHVGEWWMKDGLWCIQLDSWSHAAWSGSLENAAWRRALSIALQNASAASARQLSWRQVVTQHFTELVHRALLDSWKFDTKEQRLGLRLTTRELTTPGSFAWLEFSRTPTDIDEFRTLVEQVLEASAQVVFVGWTEHPSALQAALVFLRTSNDDESADQDWDFNEHDEDLVTEDGGSGPRRTQAGVARMLRPLLDSLESDAMVAVKATVGSQFPDVRDWALGLHSLVEAWRERTWFAPGHAIYIWGQQPIAYLLSSLQSSQIDPFLLMVSKEAEGDIFLSTDLSETLQGVLAANLNISEASRLLYLHRNTLMNRIERIRTQTGYDIRQFDDALILWVSQVLLRRRRDALPGSSVESART